MVAGIILLTAVRAKSYLRIPPLPGKPLTFRYQSVRTPPSALTRPPEYEEALTPRTRTASGHPLNTIEEEQSIISRTQTPDIPTIPLQSHDPGR